MGAGSTAGMAGRSFLPTPGSNSIIGEKLGEAETPPQPQSSTPEASNVASTAWLQLIFTRAL